MRWKRRGEAMACLLADTDSMPDEAIIALHDALAAGLAKWLFIPLI